MDAVSFYKLRGDRTSTFLDASSLLDQSICVSVGADAVAFKAGQQLLLNLANQLSRLFNQIEFELHHDNKLLAWAPRAEATLSETLLNLCNIIDPFGNFTLADQTPTKAIRIGVGNTDKDCDIFLGCDGWIAELSDTSALKITDSDSSLFGAALSSCIATAAVTLMATNQGFVPRKISAWNFQEDELAINGPEWNGELDLGKVLVVGAGAVGSCLAYWARSVGVNPDWTIIDKDTVKLHNTNRGLLFFPYQTAEYNVHEASTKCEAILEALPRLKVEINWYHESAVTSDTSFDLIIPVANEHKIRQLISKRYMPVILHATTGRNWLSQFHRHVTGKDDCIACRMGEIEKKAIFDCSEAPIDKKSLDKKSAGETDAALPFLSAGSGILLLAHLVKLATGQICESSHNDIRLDFRSTHKMAAAGIRKCHDQCGSSAKVTLAKSVYEESRWVGVLE